MVAARSSTYRLADGTFISCRPIGPRDRGKVVDGFEHLSPESRYRRFFSATPRLTTAMLDRLLHVDGRDRVAIGAEELRFGLVPGPGVGVARFARLPDRPAVAEIAVAIVDEMHCLGVGTILLGELAVAARAQGITRFSALVQPDNEAMKTLVSTLDSAARSHVEDGLLVLDLDVPDPARLHSHGARRLDRVRAFAEWLTGSVRRVLPGRLGGGPARPF